MMSKHYISCDMVSTEQPLIPALYSIALKKNSSFTPIFNYYIDSMKEKGHIDKMEAYYRMPVQGADDHMIRL